MTLFNKPLLVGSQWKSAGESRGSVYAGMNTINVAGTSLSTSGDLLPIMAQKADEEAFNHHFWPTTFEIYEK